MTNSLYRRSVLMIIAGGALLSLLGIGMRVMDNPETLQILFYRSIAQAIFLTLVVFYFNRKTPLKPFLSMGKKGLMASCLLAAGGLFMVSSLIYTSVASALFIVSLAPLSSAILGKIFLQESVSNRTWLAIIIAVLGVTIIFGDGLAGGGLLGMFFAFLMMLVYSGSIVTIRSQSQADIVAVCAFNGLLLALGVMPFIDSFAMSSHDLIICLSLGVVQIGLGMVLIIYGAQHVPAAQVSLLALLEVVLSPIWVWLAVGEEPSIYTLIGGGIVLTGVVIQALEAGQRASLSAQAKP